MAEHMDQLDVCLADPDDFLISHRPNGLQNLVAIGPNGEAPSGATFSLPSELNQARDWISQQNASGYNVYFSVNPVKRRINSKPRKADISCIEYAHLDLDPDCADGYERGREHLLGEPLEQLSATATSVVDSGNGLGAFWRHPETLPIEEGEELNKRLIAHYGGDRGTGNADRIMRMPGTINYSGKKKLRKGYPAESQASLLHLNDRVITDDFIQSLPVSDGKPLASSSGEAEAPEFCNLSEDQMEAARRRLEGLLWEDKYLRSRWKGDVSGLADASRSGYDMSLMAMLKRRGFTFSEAVCLLVEYDLPNSGATERFSENDMRYFQRCWMRSHLSLERASLAINASNPLSWVSDFTVSDQEVAAMQDPEWAVENLIVKGHLSVVCAEPNAGKTTIFMQMAREMASDGMRICYVNADVAGGDAKHYYDQAKRGRFELLLPDMKVGLSMSDIVDRLRQMNAVPGNYNDVVFIFDTLKKMTDVINKSQAKELFKILRSLTAKGMTVVCLAHTNKYKDGDGRPVYEGTGDVRSDCDELIYLIPHKQQDGSMIVSTDPDKKRCSIEKMTFVIGKDRTVSRKDQYVDTLQARNEGKSDTEDKYCIEIIRDAISEGKNCVREINDYCKHHGIGARVANRVRKQLDGVEWEGIRGAANNRLEYQLIREFDDFGDPDPLPRAV